MDIINIGKTSLRLDDLDVMQKIIENLIMSKAIWEIESGAPTATLSIEGDIIEIVISFDLSENDEEEKLRRMHWKIDSHVGKTAAAVAFDYVGGFSGRLILGPFYSLAAKSLKKVTLRRSARLRISVEDLAEIAARIAQALAIFVGPSAALLAYRRASQMGNSATSV